MPYRARHSPNGMAGGRTAEEDGTGEEATGEDGTAEDAMATSAVIAGGMLRDMAMAADATSAIEDMAVMGATEGMWATQAIMNTVPTTATTTATMHGSRSAQACLAL